MKKTFKCGAFITVLFCVVFASALVFAHAEYDCEAEGHKYEFDWDSYWYDYEFDGSTTIYAYCPECDSDFVFETEINKQIKPATTSSDGKIKYFVEFYDEENNYHSKTGGVEEIPQIGSVTLSKTTWTYSGNAIKPTVTVKDIYDEKISSKNYKVAYSSNKNVGTAKVTVTFRNLYKGSVSKIFTIKPKKPTLNSAIPKGNTVTLKWTKQTAQVDGFSLQYSLSKSFSSGVKTVKISGASSVSKTVSGLSANKTYYFRLRAYKKVNDKTYYSDYSSVKSAKTTVISISSASETLFVGKNKTLTAKTSLSGVTVKWKSSDTSVAKVSQKGVVTALKKGTANITAYVSYKSSIYKAVCKVTVKSPSITLNKSSATLHVSDKKAVYKTGSVVLSASTQPDNVSIKWSSSNSSVASVSSNGKVKAKKTGKTTITAQFNYGGKTYKKSCAVTVKYKPAITIKAAGDNSYDYWKIVEPWITVTNNTDTTIKKIMFRTEYYDEYKNILHDVDGYTGQQLWVTTETIKSGETKDFFWDEIYFNDKVHGMGITDVYVYYADGTSEIVKWNAAYWDECCDWRVN